MNRRGLALLIALMATTLAFVIGSLALRSALIDARLAADQRWQVEAHLVAASALAAGRVRFVGTLGALPDGAVDTLSTETRPDQWRTLLVARRRGSLIVLDAVARRPGPAGDFVSAHATLLVLRRAADTVQVLRHRPQF